MMVPVPGLCQERNSFHLVSPLTDDPIRNKLEKICILELIIDAFWQLREGTL